MSNPQIVALTAVGTSAGLAIDLSRFAFGVGLVIGFGSGTTAIYTVQASGDRLDTPDASKLWVNLPCLTSQTTALTSNLAFPVTAVRIIAHSLSGTLQLAVIQSA